MFARDVYIRDMFTRRLILFYPAVTATFPIFFIYGENSREGVFLSEVLVALGVVITGTLILVLSLKLVIKDSAKIALIVSIFLLLFLFYAFLRDYLVDNGVEIAGYSIGKNRFLLPFSLGFMLFSAALVLRYPKSPVPLVQAVAAAAVFLLIFNIASIVFDQGGDANSGSVGDQLITASLNPLTSTDQLPDIYYIILDAYGRADVFQTLYDFDNSEFTDFLTQAGFFVAHDSRSNYVNTEQSLASSLNMRYLGAEDDTVRAFKNSTVAAMLQGIGYRYVHIGPAWSLNKRNRNADIEIIPGFARRMLLSEFSLSLLKRSMAAPIATGLGMNIESPFNNNYARIFNDNMESLREIPNISGPTFTFNHNFPPRPLYIFKRDGSVRKGIEVNQAGSPHVAPDSYIDQVIYVNKTLQGTVEAILERSLLEPIIIIQGDHGPDTPPDVDVENPSTRFQFDRSGILNAYYLPERCRLGPYPDITPVNTFRMVFNSCLGAEFSLLEDKSYWIPGGQPIDFSQTQR